MTTIDWPLPFTFAFRDQTIRYQVLGEGPPLVLVHGTPFSSLVWRRIAPLLAHRRRVYLFDLLGFGQSSRGAPDVSLATQGALLAELLRHWRLETPDVIAHDIGGTSALRAHLLAGLDYRSLLLIDPVALAPWGSALVPHVRRFELAFAGLPAYLHEALLGAYLAGAARLPLSGEALAAYRDPWLGPVGQAAFYRQIAQLDERDTAAFEPLLGQVRCPVTLLWGLEDAWLPVERGRKLADRLPGVFIPVPGAGHLVQEDAPEAIVSHWLMRHAA